MASITLRGIPDELLTVIRALARRERRSLNSELLVLLEEGFDAHAVEQAPTPPASEYDAAKATQLEVWDGLAGQWQDVRTTEEIVADIREARTPGREIEL